MPQVLAGEVNRLKGEVAFETVDLLAIGQQSLVNQTWHFTLRRTSPLLINPGNNDVLSRMLTPHPLSADEARFSEFFWLDAVCQLCHVALVDVTDVSQTVSKLLRVEPTRIISQLLTVGVRPSIRQPAHA